jgi:diguanylate cyclase (GGDEF)-like protein
LNYLAASDLKARELECLAFQDVLTGLPNRSALHRDVQHLLAIEGQPLGLLLIDLDGFKDINDTFGHLQGDAFLREVANRFTSVVGPRGTIARLGGDEFAVLLPGLSVRDAQDVASELLGALANPVSADGLELFVGASIGVVCSPEHGRQPDMLLRRADVAMYAAKSERCGVLVYHPGRDAHDRERLELLQDLRLALTHEQLWLAYQPKVSARSRQLDSVEALVRWNHPTRGLVSPDQFVPLAEQAGLSDMLARWVLTTALTQCQAWQELGYRIPVWVNISMYELRDETFPRFVADQLAASGVPPELLGIEITESAAMANTARTRTSLMHLRMTGVRVAIDDFGTGYSSLAYLAGLPVDEVKIDRSFVLGMRSSTQHAAIVRATINLGHDLGLAVVAEGVEDEQAEQQLREQRCDLIQGYGVCRPVTAPQLVAWFRSQMHESSQAA